MLTLDFKPTFICAYETNIRNIRLSSAKASEKANIYSFDYDTNRAYHFPYYTIHFFTYITGTRAAVEALTFLFKQMIVHIVF